jgi:hypothetical protein
LRFSALSLRRTGSTPDSTRFTRLELGLFTKPSIRMTSYKLVNTGLNPSALKLKPGETGGIGNRMKPETD